MTVESLSCLAGTFYILAGSDTDRFLEHIGEMALIAKPCFNGSFRYLVNCVNGIIVEKRRGSLANYCYFRWTACIRGIGYLIGSKFHIQYTQENK